MRAWLLLAASLGPVLAGQDVVANGHYGFAGFELYKLSDGIFGLCAGDLDGDGLLDLALVDNARSRIECFLRLSDEEDDAVSESFADDTANPIQFDGRYERKRIPLQRRVQRLDLGDFDGDGRDELAFTTDGGRLSVRSLDADEGRTLVLDELSSGCQLLRAVDLDSDGRDDLVAAGEARCLLLRSGADGELAPTPLEAVGTGVGAVDVADLDGDGLADLVTTYFGKDYPFRIRRGQPEGAWGPRLDLDLPQVRSARIADLDGDGRAEVLSVARLTGRVSVARLVARGGDLRGLARYPLRRSNGKRSGASRSFAVGDLDGDGADDVIVAEADAAQLVLLRAVPASRTFTGKEFPSLVGVASPRLADVDGDGRRELVVRSGPERMVGLASLDERGRLPFPRLHALDGEPLALDTADLNADGFDDVLIAVARGEGRRRTFSLQILYGSAAGLADGAEVHELESVKKPPGALRTADVDRDGATDVLVFVPGDDEVPALLVQRDGGFVTDDRGSEAPGLGIFRGVRAANVSYVDVDGDGRQELVVATENFARALTFDVAEGGRLSPVVLEQLNGPAPDSRVTGFTMADLDGDGAAEVVMRDERTHELFVHTRAEDGELRRTLRVEAGRLDYAGLVPADLDADGRADLLVLGRDEIGVLYGAADDWTLRTTRTHDPRLERVHFDRLAAGDLDDDGALDVVVTEASESSVVVLRPREGALDHALGFRVFEEKNFGQGGTSREPRELLSADLTGDGKDDLAVIVHDKLIVYVQE